MDEDIIVGVDLTKSAFRFKHQIGTGELSSGRGFRCYKFGAVRNTYLTIDQSVP